MTMEMERSTVRTPIATTIPIASRFCRGVIQAEIRAATQAAIREVIQVAVSALEEATVSALEEAMALRFRGP
tara:strand:- start:730 stop:945 length:216 start_codon:yes stop_codon:yes gene_type:complete